MPIERNIVKFNQLNERGRRNASLKKKITYRSFYQTFILSDSNLFLNLFIRKEKKKSIFSLTDIYKMSIISLFGLRKKFFDQL